LHHYEFYLSAGPSTKIYQDKIVYDTTFTCTDTLDELTEYEWSIQVWDEYDYFKIGPKWYFTTGTGFKNPPIITFNPDPEDFATGTSLFAALSWDCYDPDNDPVMYDVLLYTVGGDTALVGSGLTEKSVAPSGLDADTRYYWRVLAFDTHDLPFDQTARCRLTYATLPGNSPTYTIRDVSFFRVPPDSIDGLPPVCEPPAAAVFEVADDPSAGLVLKIYNTSDPALGPVVFDEIQWAIAPVAFPPDQLDWGNSALEALSWTNVTNTLPYYLYSGDPALISDIPDNLQSEESALFLYIMSSPYGEQRGIWQSTSDETISVESTTWGRLKTIYKTK
jgi:hypothetical protein